MATARHYEPGMNFTFDETSGKASVTFRGRIAVLAGRFGDECDARIAAEAYCRKLGWKAQEASQLRAAIAKLNQPP